MNWRKTLCWELHVSRFCFYHHNWKTLAYTPWLPQKPYFQWVYLLYRWLLALFFIVHLFWSFIASDKIHFYIFLTDWGFTLLTVYLLWSAVSVTVRYLRQHCSYCNECPRDPGTVEVEQSIKPSGCCGTVHNTLQWYEVIHWVFFLLGVEMAVSISLLYWPLFYDPDHPDKLLTHINVVLHMVNGIVAIVDMWISRTPVRLYHVVYLMAFGSLYATFTGIYYAAGGGNDYNNGTYIYPQLDYGSHPVQASALTVGTGLFYLPIIHLMFYCNYLLREGVLYLLYACRLQLFRKNIDYSIMFPDEEEETENSLSDNNSSSDEEPISGIV